MQRTISDYIEDMVHNAVEAGSSLVILEAVEADGRFGVTVADNGPGMDDETKARALDPFGTDPKKHAARKVGLGLPFLMEALRQTNGVFDLRSEPGTGTSLHFVFDRGHVDTPPTGDLASTWTALMNFATDRCELAIRRRRGDRSWSVSRSELAEAVGELDRAGALSLARAFFRELEMDESGSEV